VRAGAHTRAHGSMRSLPLRLALLVLAGKLLLGPLVAARNQLLDQAAALRLVVLVAVLELLQVGDALVGRHRGELGVDGVAVLWAGLVWRHGGLGLVGNELDRGMAIWACWRDWLSCEKLGEMVPSMVPTWPVELPRDASCSGVDFLLLLPM
jgi:hypothetical protein